MIKKYIKQLISKLVYFRRKQAAPEKAISEIFFRRMGRHPDLEIPKTFNEKLQWLKLHNHNPLYTKLVDKAEVKGYVASKIGTEYIIPTIRIYDRLEEIDFNDLPDRFVLKCTHDSGGLVICKEKQSLDIRKAKKKIKRSLATNYYYLGFEWPYKDVKHRIIVEPYFEDTETGTLRDYKFYVFNGEVKILKLATDRDIETGEVNMDFYDMDFNHLPFKRGHEHSKIPLKKPIQFELMKELAEKLAGDIPFVRVDFYEVDGKVYFGEMTFFPASGWVPFDPPEWDLKLGNWLKLPNLESNI